MEIQVTEISAPFLKKSFTNVKKCDNIFLFKYVYSLRIRVVAFNLDFQRAVVWCEAAVGFK